MNRRDLIKAFAGLPVVGALAAKLYAKEVPAVVKESEDSVTFTLQAVDAIVDTETTEISFLVPQYGGWGMVQHSPYNDFILWAHYSRKFEIGDIVTYPTKTGSERKWNPTNDFIGQIVGIDGTKLCLIAGSVTKDLKFIPTRGEVQ